MGVPTTGRVQLVVLSPQREEEEKGKGEWKDKEEDRGKGDRKRKVEEGEKKDGLEPDETSCWW